LGVFHKPNAAKLSRVVEAKAAAVSEVQDHAIMFARFVKAGWLKDQVATHAQMDEEGVSFKLE
jgi:hypothetical protein